MIDLTNKTAKQKAQIKSKELAKVKLSKFKKDNLDIEIIGDIKSIEVNGSHGIELFATAYKNGKQLGFGKDGTIEIERFRFFNPPVLVDDPNGDIIREIKDPLTNEIEYRKLKYNPQEAIRQSLAHTISQVAKDGKNIIKGKIGNTTSTFYPDADAESTSVDGLVGMDETSATWAAMRDGAGNWVNDTIADYKIGTFYQSSATTNQWMSMLRGIFLFDTSAIGTDTVDSATMSIYGTAKLDGLATTPDMNVYVSNPASNTGLVAADYTTLGSTAKSTTITYANWATAGYNDFALNDTAVVDGAGITKLGTRNVDSDVDNVMPNWIAFKSSYLQGYYADQTGTANDPKLVVVHTAASAGSANQTLSLLGIQ